MTSRRRVAITAALVFLAALGLRALYLSELARTPYLDERELISDAAYYDMRAREIAGGDLIGDAPGFLSPFYCLVLGIVYAVTGPSLLAAKAFQAGLAAASCALLYLGARHWFGENAACGAGAALAVYGPHVYYGGTLLPTQLEVFLHVLLLWLLAGTPGVGRALAAGVVLGLAVLTKSNAILLLPAIALVWWGTHRTAPPRRRLAWCASLAAAMLATIAPLTFTNYELSGRFLLVATNSGSNLLKGNGPTATGTHAFLPLGAEFTGLRAHLDHVVDPTQAVEQSAALAREAVRYMLAHPLRTSGLFAKKLLLLLNARELGIRDHYDFARSQIPLLRWPLLSFWAVVPLGLAGVALGWGERRAYAMPLAILAVQLVSFLLVFVLARYRLVAIALLLPFAARSILDGVAAARRSDGRRLAQVGAVWLAFLALAFVPFAEFPRERGIADQRKFLGDVQQAHERHAAAVEQYRAALAADWQDPRRDAALRWETMLNLVRSLVALDRQQEALGVLDDLSAELRRNGPAAESPLTDEADRLRRTLQGE